MNMRIIIPAQSEDFRLLNLKRALADFYAGNKTYYEHAEGEKEFVYRPILCNLIERRKILKKPLRVLELGAGRTSFPAFVRKHGADVDIDFIAHDINDTNREFYERNKIRYVIGDYSNIVAFGPFDLCFSTYVFEHLVEPHRFLNIMAQNLTQNGSLVIVCPKYFFPGYVPPAIRWLPWWKKQLLTCFLSLSSLKTRFFKRSKFWICIEPAVFKLPWRRDFDAVHLVSTPDVKAALGRNFIVRPFRLDRKGVKTRLIDKLTVLSIIADRRVPFEYTPS